MNRARLAVIPLAAVALAGCAITGGTGHAQLTPAAACRYLHLDLDHGGEVPFPRIPALQHVAADMDQTREGRAFRATVRKVAADEAARSLARWARIGPDFAALMNGCAPVAIRRVPAGPQRYISAATAAQTYMAAHPARPVRGMTAAVVIRQLRDLPLPGNCAPHRIGVVGGPDMCFTWAYVAVTVSGGRLRISCGLPMSRRHPRGVSCTDGSGPEPGDYVYVPDGGGKITSLRGVRTIREWAIDVESRGVPAGGA